MNAFASELARWDTFCSIVGSAAGALIGLQFVVMTLVSQRPVTQSSGAGAAYATPTIIHFSAVLLLAAVLRAPWQTVTPLAAFWGIAGFVGFLYSIAVARRIRKHSYQPVFEDWLFHCGLPLVAYAILVAAAFAAPSYTREALFAVGGASLLLLFTGIHNAWDAVTYHVFVRLPNRDNQ
jgi:hypothetical protein